MDTVFRDSLATLRGAFEMVFVWGKLGTTLKFLLRCSAFFPSVPFPLLNPIPLNASRIQRCREIGRQVLALKSGDLFDIHCKKALEDVTIPEIFENENVEDDVTSFVRRDSESEAHSRLDQDARAGVSPAPTDVGVGPEGTPACAHFVREATKRQVLHEGNPLRKKLDAGHLV